MASRSITTLRLRQRLIVTALLVVCASGEMTFGEEKELAPRDYVRMLEGEDLDLWPTAIKKLIEEYDSPYTRTVLLRHFNRLDAEERLRIVEHVSRWVEEEYIFEALLKQTYDENISVRKKALEAVMWAGSNKRYVGLYWSRVVDLLSHDHPERVAILEWTGGTYSRAQKLTGGKDLGPDGVPAETPDQMAKRLYVLILPALHDPDPVVRGRALDIMAKLPDPRVNEIIAPLTQDPDPKVRKSAHWKLAYRGVWWALKHLVDEGIHMESHWHRWQRLHYLNGPATRAYLPEFFEMYKRAQNTVERESAEILIQGSNVDLPEKIAISLDPYLNDPDEKVRALAEDVVWKKDRTKRREARKKLIAMIMPTLLTVATLVATFLGLVLFVWGFRLLKLRSLVQGLGISKAQSLAIGLIAMQGKISSETGSLSHPLTGESCLFYPGADIKSPQCRLRLEDKTGEVLIDPRGAVLLSESGILKDGDSVYLMGTAKPNPKGKPGEIVIAKNRETKPFFFRIAHFLVRRVLGGAAQGSDRILFGDPRSFFWIWDDARARPMFSGREVSLLFSVFFFAGVWTVVFMTATFVTLDGTFSSALSDFLRSLEPLDVNLKTLWGIVKGK